MFWKPAGRNRHQDLGIDGAGSPVSQFVVLASRSTSFDDRTDVTGGSVGVAAGASNTLTAGSDTHIAVGRVLLSPVVVLRERATTGEIGSNAITAPPSAVTGPRSAYVAPPPQPVPGTITAGATPVTVNAGQTVNLAPGAFGAVNVNGTLNLSGGLYQFQSLRVNNDARVVALASSTVRVSTTVTALDRTRIVSAGSLGAGALRLIVGSTAAAVTFGNDGQLTALVDARGDVRAGDRFIFSGAIAGRDVIIGHDGRLALGTGGGFQCANNANCNDNNTCTTDTCSDTVCARVTLPNGAMCNDSTLCTQTDRCQAGICVGSNPVGCVASDQCHVAGVCDPTTGTCSNPAKPNRTPCNDGNECTLSDQCTAGCAAAPPAPASRSTPATTWASVIRDGPVLEPAALRVRRLRPTAAAVHADPAAEGAEAAHRARLLLLHASGWQPAACAPDGFVQAKFGIPTLALSSDTYVDMGTSNRIPLVYGQVEVLFPRTEGETDLYVPSICDPMPGVPAYADTANQWSVQANTNFFGPSGNNWFSSWSSRMGQQRDLRLADPERRRRGHRLRVQVLHADGGAARGRVAELRLRQRRRLRRSNRRHAQHGLGAELGRPRPAHLLRGRGHRPVRARGQLVPDGWVRRRRRLRFAGVVTNTAAMTRLAVSSCPGDTQAGSAILRGPEPEPHATIQTCRPRARATI